MRPSIVLSFLLLGVSAAFGSPSSASSPKAVVRSHQARSKGVAHGAFAEHRQREKRTLQIAVIGNNEDDEDAEELDLVKRGKESKAAKARRLAKQKKAAKARKAKAAAKSSSLLRAKHGGDGTFFGVGLGACGKHNTDKDYIVAVSHLLYDSFPGATPNPNNNPVCGRRIRATLGGRSVVVKVADRCVGCKKFDLDFSPAAFKKLAAFSKGRVQIKWQFI